MIYRGCLHCGVVGDHTCHRAHAHAADAEAARLRGDAEMLRRELVHARQTARDAMQDRAETTEECARLRAAGDAAAFREGILRRDRDALAMERDHYRERAQTLRARVDWMQSVAAEAMRVGLATCRDLRGRLRGEGLRLARATAAVEGLRAIVEAADELVSCDYAAEVESYSETAPGSHAAAQARAADAYGALVRMRDAWRETHGAIATPPTVAAESATVAPKGKR